MTGNQAVASYWEIFKKRILDDSKTKYEYTEIIKKKCEYISNN